jgi:hypothetical protein
VGGRSIGLSPINFIGWEWTDRRYFNFHRHSLRTRKVTYLTSVYTSRRKLPILQRLLDKPTESSRFSVVKTHDVFINR